MDQSRQVRNTDDLSSAHVARMDVSYASVFSQKEINHHAQLAASIDPTMLALVEAEALEEAYWRVTIVGYDYPGELSLICGLLFAFGAEQRRFALAFGAHPVENGLFDFFGQISALDAHIHDFDAEFRGLAPASSSVLSGRIGPLLDRASVAEATLALQEELVTLSATKLAFRVGVSGHWA